jgi:general secretion pathway protein I
LSRERRSKAAGADAGFTMLEVLIALAVISGVLAAVGSVVASTTHAVPQLEQRVALVETTRSVAAGLLTGDGLTSQAGNMAGYRWRMDVTPWAGEGVALLPDSAWVPLTVDIRVQSPSGALLTLRTVRLQKRSGG